MAVTGKEPWSANDEWPPGWYADPWQAGRERRWTGTPWTAETRGAEGASIAARGGGAPPARTWAPRAAALPPPPLCNARYASEALRTARLQIDMYDATATPLFSTEAVLYKNAAATAQAFAELHAIVRRCPQAPVVSPVGEPTIATTFNAVPD